jgi:thiol-disulfide isomerase/thioredoxin
MIWGSNRELYFTPLKPRRSPRSTIRSVVSVGVVVLFAGTLLFLAGASLRVAFGSISRHALSYSKTWELMDLDGKPVKSSDFEGKVLILDFWATSCPPCDARIPGFIELQSKYGEKGLVVVGVLLDEEGPSVARQMKEEVGINYPVLVGASNIVEYFGGMEIPSTFIIDKSGKVVARHIGFVSKETFEREITPLL